MTEPAPVLHEVEVRFGEHGITGVSLDGFALKGVLKAVIVSAYDRPAELHLTIRPRDWLAAPAASAIAETDDGA